MIKTGKKVLLFLIPFFVFLTSNAAFSQEVTVEATLSEANIFSGESVQMSIKISGQALNSIERPNIPNIDGLRWLSGSTSQSQNFTYVNGKPSISYTYGYQFIAQAPGDYIFPGLPVSVNGEKFTTKELRFKVLDPKTIDSGNADRSPDIYVRLEPSSTEPVVGEQVIADIVLYFKSEIEIPSFQASPGWKAEGFWKEDLENRKQTTTTSSIIGGVRYQRARLLQYAIFPTKSGELTLSPFEITVQVRKKNRRRDIFSFGLGQERMDLSTLPVTINVKPLPDLQNSTFSGGVGDFQITRSIKPAKAFVGESIEIMTSISGKGNIPLIVKPEFEYPETLEQYNPQESSSITRNNRQVGGTKTFTDILIARNEGSYEIPESRMAFYNPAQKRYSTITLPTLYFEAERDPRASVSSTEELRFDITPITGLAQWVSADQVPLTTRRAVWLLLLAPLLVLGGAYSYKSYSDKMNNDSAFARSQKAKEKALEELNFAANQNDIKIGYYHIQKALNQFISDKLDLPQAGMSIEQIIERLKEASGNQIAKEVKLLLEKCETIAYAPNATQAGLETDIQKTKDLIKTIGKLV